MSWFYYIKNVELFLELLPRTSFQKKQDVLIAVKVMVKRRLLLGYLNIVWISFLKRPLRVVTIKHYYHLIFTYLQVIRALNMTVSSITIPIIFTIRNEALSIDGITTKSKIIFVIRMV